MVVAAQYVIENRPPTTSGAAAFAAPIGDAHIASASVRPGDINALSGARSAGHCGFISRLVQPPPANAVVSLVRTAAMRARQRCRDLDRTKFLRLLAAVAAVLAAAPAAAQIIDPVARGLAAMSLLQNAPTNAIPYAYNVDPTKYGVLRKAVAAARAGVSHVNIAVIGTSIDWGVDGTTMSGSFSDINPNSWPNQLALLGVVGLPAENDSWFGNGNAESNSATLAVANPKITLGSGWAFSGGVVFSVGDYGYTNSTNANNLVYAPTNKVDTCVIYGYQKSGQGSYTWSVDSGSQSSAVSLSGVTGLVANTVSMGSLGTHTLNIERYSGSVSIGGVHCYNSTISQVSILNWAVPGAEASFFNQSSSTYSWQPGNVIGLPPFNGVSLCIIDVGPNEWINGDTTTAQFRTSMQSIINACQLTGNVILVEPFPTATSYIPYATQNQFRSVIQQLAAPNHLALIDWQGRVGGSWTVAAGTGDAGASYVHPAQGVAGPNFAAGLARVIKALTD